MNGFVFVPSSQNAQSSGALALFNRSGRGGGALELASGDTLLATLLNRVNGQATLRTEDDFTFTVPGDTVQGQVGDILHFRVVNQDNSGLALRQIFPESSFKAMLERGNAGIEDVKNVIVSGF